MNCPACPDSTLVITERSGIEIDYCATCRGVWLDRGELDKIIERSATSQAVSPPFPPSRQERSPDRSDRYAGVGDDWFDDDNDRSRDDDPPGDGRRRPKRRRESFLGDLFDF